MNGFEWLVVPISVFCVFIGEVTACSPTSIPANFQTYRPSYFKVRECGQRPLQPDRRRRKRVAAGSDAEEGDWPWLVSLKLDGSHLCSGVLIDSDWVATAAHCVYIRGTDGRVLHEPENVTVTAGTVEDGSYGNDQETQGSQTRDVSNIYLHPGYPGHVGMHNHDFALLKLSEPLEIGTLVQTACIHMEEDAFQPGKSECYVAGWGKFFRADSKNKPETLQYSRVPLHENCTSYAESVSRRQMSFVSDQKLCAGAWSRDLIYGPCKGDSGGPLVCLDDVSRSWFVIGVVSHGPKCGEVGFYTKIYSMLGYIEEVISGNVTDDDFECHDGLDRIPYERQCDGFVDCADMSDEVHCECSENQFQCDNGVCRLQTEKCDAIADCDDGSDEIDCEYFRCRTTGLNISVSHRCDGEDNCGDWSDEDPTICECDESTHFRCPVGPCIPLSWRCDGETDCGTVCSDEGDCSELDADEVNCTCREGYFTCDNGRCVPGEAVCDAERVNHCGDNSDERDCGGDPCIYCAFIETCISTESVNCDPVTFAEYCEDADYSGFANCWTV